MMLMVVVVVVIEHYVTSKRYDTRLQFDLSTQQKQTTCCKPLTQNLRPLLNTSGWHLTSMAFSP